MNVELFGLARVLVGHATVDLAVDEPTDLAAFLRALAGAFPVLRGTVIDGERFIEPNLLLLDGRRALGPGETFGARDKPCVLFLASGG